LNPWKQAEKIAGGIMHSILSQNYLNELGVLAKILNKLPQKTELHLANSLSVRLANFIGLQPDRDDITIYSNRGTSGIDGSNSTAMGMSLVSENPVVLITGDMAFFYDRNAFWHKYNPSNLFIIILNNHAGGIFGVIEGPSEQPELKEFFETEQKLTAGYAAAEFQMDYFCADSYESLDKAINKFFEQTGRTKILEIETDLSLTKKVFQDLKSAINKINL
jgi:2-succinyl-5-enolpyruvyl-6-hydroxy-3-cyclohexene-1-carboxylate synthase